MAMKLHDPGYRRARKLVANGKFVFDGRDDWSEHQPSTAEANRFIEANGLDEYGKWFLGVDTDAGERTKGRFKFPYGDFEMAHRCGVLAAEVRAGQYKYFDIEQAAAHLHGMIDGAKAKPQ